MLVYQRVLLFFCCKRKAMKGTSQLAKDKWVNPGLCMKDLEGNQSAEPTTCIQVGGWTRNQLVLNWGNLTIVGNYSRFLQTSNHLESEWFVDGSSVNWVSRLRDGAGVILKWRYCTHIRPYFVGIFPYIYGHWSPGIEFFYGFSRMIHFPKHFFGVRFSHRVAPRPGGWRKAFIGLKHIHGTDGLDSGTMVGVHSLSGWQTKKQTRVP